MIKKSKIYILVIWTIIVFILIAFPMPDYEGTKVTLYDKIVHVFLFGIFAYLIFQVLVDVKKIRKFLVVSISFFISVLYSAAAEFLQNYIPGRTVSEYDFLSGVIGAIIFVFIANLRYEKK